MSMSRRLLAFVAAGWLASCATAAWGDEAKKDEKRVLEPGKWYPGVEAGISLTQSSYSNNWHGGEKGSIVWAALANATIENQIHPKVNWNNTLKLAYGQTHQQSLAEDGTRSWDRPDKTTDLLDLESVARFTLGGFVDPFASVRFESQFQDVSDPAGRILSINPIKLKESAGVARRFIDTEDRLLMSRLGLTLRQSSRKSFTEAAPSTATTSETSNDGGLEMVTDMKRKILENRVAWTSKLTLYQPFFYSGKDELEDLTVLTLEAAHLDPDIADFSTALDADFENIFSAAITKILSVNLYLRWMYDKYDNSVLPVLGDDGSLTNGAAVAGAVRKGGQLKQTLSIGLTYRFL